LTQAEEEKYKAERTRLKKKWKKKHLPDWVTTPEARVPFILYV